jgi:glutamate--cysteine ligase
LKASTASRLDLLTQAGLQHLLRGGLKGLEKESLRVGPEGRIARTPHPRALGSALTHPSITTDYSEALIELITPPFAEAADTLDYLEDLHRFAHGHLGEELLLATSMPCAIEGEESIPIAVYGSSNIGRMKHVYRRGLAWRYGRAMQAIAGIHFNYSVNEALWPALRELLGRRDALRNFVDEQYFGLIRNAQRNGWLIPFLFGASPAFCKSFFKGRENLAAHFQELDAHTLYRPYATSLRMSDIGYRNDSQAGLEISLNSLDEYVASLCRAIATPYPAYEAMGVEADGEFRQLNANILQIENEYYSAIRPKQIAGSGEKPTLALRRRGVRYVELRSMDIDGGLLLGIDLPRMRFLELFLLDCLLRESPPMDAQEAAEANRNSLGAACCGRTPDFRLFRGGREVTLQDWARELAEGLSATAEVLDQGQADAPWRECLKPLHEAIEDPEATPSARALAQMRENRESFQEYALRLSARHAQAFRKHGPKADRAAAFRQEAEASLLEQARVEASDTLSFREFLRNYFAQC